MYFLASSDVQIWVVQVQVKFTSVVTRLNELCLKYLSSLAVTDRFTTIKSLK